MRFGCSQGHKTPEPGTTEPGFGGSGIRRGRDGSGRRREFTSRLHINHQLEAARPMRRLRIASIFRNYPYRERVCKDVFLA